ncbi:hypothetical protein BDW02DRAFT_569557 [Decorospora gaudefroyi]|uniref:Uncharacterized protein n=1 Tax=Decorospora gaudefroyi TaxID=184978 RepID=A0A6A5K9A4_9PLEO|nr:hypothetical protein BDW02DRAFT_569557 [Decorospora gaudefroyi]
MLQIRPAFRRLEPSLSAVQSSCSLTLGVPTDRMILRALLAGTNDAQSAHEIAPLMKFSLSATRYQAHGWRLHALPRCHRPFNTKFRSFVLRSQRPTTSQIPKLFAETVHGVGTTIPT